MEMEMQCSACRVAVSGVLCCPSCAAPFCAESCRSLHLCTVDLQAAVGRLKLIHSRRAEGV